MSALSEHVSLTITQDSVQVTRLGFGVPMILSVNATFSERIRYYTDLTGLVTDGFATTSPEYLAAAMIMSQNPSPETYAIGRAVGEPTQVYTLNISVVEHSHTYRLNVRGPGITTTEVAVAADSATTDGEIVTALVTALNAITPNTYIAAGATSPFTITADVAGGWFSVESVEPGYIKIAQTHVEPATTLADDLAAIQLENDNWYAVYTLYNSEPYVKAVAAWVETQKKIYIADSSASEGVTLASAGTGTSDLLDDLATSNYARTAGVYHPNPAAMLGAAWLGTRLPYDPGAETWKFARPAGITPVTLTGTHRVNLRAKSANTLQTVGGVNIMWEGTTTDGDFIDVIRGLDWLQDDMTAGVFGAMAGALKVPYTKQGMALIESQIRASLARAIARGIISDDVENEPVVTLPKITNISAADKGLRLLPDVRWSATLAGAIHKVQIAGTVSV